MTDVKVHEEATVASSITGTEVSYIVQDPSGTPAAAQVTKAVEKAYYSNAPTITGTATIDRILPTVSSTADPTSLDWTGTKDILAWTFTANRTISLSNVPTTAGASKTIYASAASGGPWVPTFTSGIILGGTPSIPSGGGTVVITLTTIGSGNFTVRQTLSQSEVDGLVAALAAKQALDATLTALAGLDTVVGAVFQTGTDTFTKYVLDTDLSSVSGSDDTVASAKAIKAALDTKETIVSPSSEADNFSLLNGDIVRLTGGASKTATLPATTARWSCVVDNASGNSWTIARADTSAPEDSINGSAANDTLATGKAVTYYCTADNTIFRIGALS